MEVKNCKVNGVHFLSWFEAGKFFVEEVESNRQLILSASQVVWFLDNILELTKKPTSSFSEKDRWKI